jgi:capsular exopolysaccharide synthesis family protein
MTSLSQVTSEDFRVSDDSPNVDSRCVSLTKPESFEADQYRMLRLAVERACPVKGCRVVAVTSPVAGDGKTLTAVNLAGAIAKASELRVLLLDTDLRRPAIGKVLGRSGREGWGLIDAILDRRQSLEHASWRLDQYNLSVVTSRRPESDTYELLASDRFSALLRDARERFDYVVVDSPPVLPIPDTRLLAEIVDGFIIVVGANKTPRRLLEETLTLLGPAKVLGLVFNSEKYRHSRYGKYYYAYHKRG